MSAALSMLAPETTLADNAALIRAEAKTGTPGGIKSLMQGRTDMFRLNPYDLHTKPGWNFRDFSEVHEREALYDLASSIAARGVNTPLKVYVEGDKVYVSAGHRRRTATLIAIEEMGAPIMTVPVIMGPRGETDADRILEQFTTNTGRAPSAIQVAGIFAKLMNFGWTEAKIAAESGMTAQKVRQTIDLLSMPEEVQALVASGAVSAHMARSVVASEGDAAVTVLNDAVKVAKQAGAKSVLPKHTGAVTPMKKLADIFGKAYTDSDNDDNILVTIPAEKWTLVREILKL